MSFNERDPTTLPESLSGDAEEDEDDEADDKSKKKKTQRVGSSLAGLAGEKLIKKDELSARHETIWQRLDREADDKKTEDKPALPNSLQPEGAQAEADAETTVPMESLSPDEERLVALQYADRRQAALSEELSTAEPDSTAAVTIAAREAFIGRLQNILAAPDAPAPEVAAAMAGEATAAGLSRLQPEVNDAVPAEATAASEATDPAESSPSEAAADEPAEPVASGGGGGAELPPPGPPETGAGAYDPGDDSGLPPYYRAAYGSSAAAGAAAPGAESSRSADAMISEENSLYYEQKALQRGLLTGGIVGYLFGRRRGRIKTEKKLLPVQRKLERAVSQLHDTIFRQEQRIHSLAAEQAAAAGGAAERQRLVSQLQAKPTRRAAVQTAERLRPLPTANQTHRRREKPPRELSEQRNLAWQSAPRKRTERLGRIILETLPAAAAALAARRKTEVVPFYKKAEQFSHRELLLTAEKIRIDNVPLKQMYEAGRFGENGLRRIVAEFLGGGNVQAALAHELLEKELTYERDPQLKRPAVSATGGGGGNAADPTNVQSQLLSAPQPLSPHTLPAPQPDAATLTALKRRQAASLAGASLVIVLAVLLIILLLR